MTPLVPSAAFRLPPDEELRIRFAHVTTWIFDLDNTLYPPDSGIWRSINERITLFLVHLFGIDGLSASALRQHYYLRHGATLRGLIENDRQEAERFLEFVHDIDRSALSPNPALAREVARLPGRKLIFTNGSRDHAVLTAGQLGLDGLFEDIFDIVAAKMTPKPAEAAYDAFFDRYQIDPCSAAMFEDVGRNLVVPKARGVTTILVAPSALETGWSDDDSAESAADFVTDDLCSFLARFNGAGPEQ